MPRIRQTCLRDLTLFIHWVVYLNICKVRDTEVPFGIETSSSPNCGSFFLESSHGILPGVFFFLIITRSEAIDVGLKGDLVVPPD